MFDPTWLTLLLFAVSELIFEPLIEHIKRQGGKVQVSARAWR